MPKTHHYSVTVRWTGNKGSGTSSYRGYDRDHEISGRGKIIAIPGSSDPAFRGAAVRWNPEELLVASLSACHKLWYLHLCSISGISVVEYVDNAEGLMTEDEDGAGRFERVILRPEVTITKGSDESRARDLHDSAHAKCFIANSVNFPVEHFPKIILVDTTAV